MSTIIYDITHGTWQVVASTTDDAGVARVEFTHDGQPRRTIEYPAYKVWNIAAHLGEIVEDFEDGMAQASSTGLEGLTS